MNSGIRMLGWQGKGQVGPIGTPGKAARKQLAKVDVAVGDSTVAAPTLYQCMVKGCGKQFKRKTPMAKNHVVAKHPEVKDWEKVIKAV